MLRDLLAAGLPAGDLREIHRNSGSIVKACAAIRDCRPWQYDAYFDLEAGLNLKLDETRDNAHSLEALVQTLHKLPALAIDPVWDTQVLVTVNRNSELGRIAVNKRLQIELNPYGVQAPGCPFRLGDKVIRIRRNTLMPCAETPGRTRIRTRWTGKRSSATGSKAGSWASKAGGPSRRYRPRAVDRNPVW